MKQTRYMVQYRKVGQKWLTFPHRTAADLDEAFDMFDDICARPRPSGTRYQLVEQTTVVCDKVLEAER